MDWGTLFIFLVSLGIPAILVTAIVLPIVRAWRIEHPRPAPLPAPTSALPIGAGTARPMGIGTRILLNIGDILEEHLQEYLERKRTSRAAVPARTQLVRRIAPVAVPDDEPDNEDTDEEPDEEEDERTILEPDPDSPRIPMIPPVSDLRARVSTDPTDFQVRRELQDWLVILYQFTNQNGGVVSRDPFLKLGMPPLIWQHLLDGLTNKRGPGIFRQADLVYDQQLTLPADQQWQAAIRLVLWLDGLSDEAIIDGYSEPDEPDE